MDLTIVKDTWSREFVGCSFIHTMKANKPQFPLSGWPSSNEEATKASFSIPTVAFNSPIRPSENYAPSIESFSA